MRKYDGVRVLADPPAGLLADAWQAHPFSVDGFAPPSGAGCRRSSRLGCNG